VDKDIEGDRPKRPHWKTESRASAPYAAAGGRHALLGSGLPSVARSPASRLDRARVLLGCLQPGPNVFNLLRRTQRLADRLHYLNSSDDKTQDATRFWFDTRANWPGCSRG